MSFLQVHRLSVLILLLLNPLNLIADALTAIDSIDRTVTTQHISRPCILANGLQCADYVSYCSQNCALPVNASATLSCTGPLSISDALSPARRCQVLTAKCALAGAAAAGAARTISNLFGAVDIPTQTRRPGRLAAIQSGLQNRRRQLENVLTTMNATFNTLRARRESLAIQCNTGANSLACASMARLDSSIAGLNTRIQQRDSQLRAVFAAITVAASKVDSLRAKMTAAQEALNAQRDCLCQRKLEICLNISPTPTPRATEQPTANPTERPTEQPTASPSPKPTETVQPNCNAPVTLSLVGSTPAGGLRFYLRLVNGTNQTCGAAPISTLFAITSDGPTFIKVTFDAATPIANNIYLAPGEAITLGLTLSMEPGVNFVPGQYKVIFLASDIDDHLPALGSVSDSLTCSVESAGALLSCVH